MNVILRKLFSRCALFSSERILANFVSCSSLALCAMPILYSPVHNHDHCRCDPWYGRWGEASLSFLRHIARIMQNFLSILYQQKCPLLHSSYTRAHGDLRSDPSWISIFYREGGFLVRAWLAFRVTILFLGIRNFACCPILVFDLSRFLSSRSHRDTSSRLFSTVPRAQLRRGPTTVQIFDFLNPTYSTQFSLGLA